MASDMDLEQQEREEELKRLEEDVKNSDVALDKLNCEYEEQMDEMAEEPEQEHGKVWLFFGKLHKALEKNLGRNIIIGVYAITVIRIIADLVMFMRGVFYVDYAMVPRNFFYYFFSIVIQSGYGVQNRVLHSLHSRTERCGDCGLHLFPFAQ